MMNGSDDLVGLLKHAREFGLLGPRHAVAAPLGGGSSAFGRTRSVRVNSSRDWLRKTRSSSYTGVSA